MVRTMLAAIAVLALLAPSRADECADASSQARLDECAGKVFQAADKALGTAYKSVMDRLGSEQEGRKLLVAAQKDWLAYRDGECAFEAASSAGGSVHPMVVTQCKTTLTKVRTQSLQRMLSCREGDVACPLPPK